MRQASRVLCPVFDSAGTHPHHLAQPLGARAEEGMAKESFIRDALIAEGAGDGTEADTPLPQQVGLVAGNVFVVDFHATAATSSASRPS